MGADLRDSVKALDINNPSNFVDEFLRLANSTLPRDDRALLQPSRMNNTLGYRNSTRKALIRFITNIQESESAVAAVHAYFSYLQSQCDSSAYIALKAADQIPCLPLLQSASPSSKKIAVIRDGRDAAVSAEHFRQLMNKVDAPWTPGVSSYADRIYAWAHRVRLLLKYKDKYDITILRYEDLQNDFIGVANALFNKLDIPLDLEDITRIHEKTKFETVSGGRKPGEEAESVVRKGVVGEWRDVLSTKDANRAWKLAGRELEACGYSSNGMVGSPPAFVLKSYA
tara:strand:+ start:1418 stop:2269 length:852 start_codon:yes stop_codon:yes gene_type:complete